MKGEAKPDHRLKKNLMNHYFSLFDVIWILVDILFASFLWHENWFWTSSGLTTGIDRMAWKFLFLDVSYVGPAFNRFIADSRCHHGWLRFHGPLFSFNILSMKIWTLLGQSAMQCLIFKLYRCSLDFHWYAVSYSHEVWLIATKLATKPGGKNSNSHNLRFPPPTHF